MTKLAQPALTLAPSSLWRATPDWSAQAAIKHLETKAGMISGKDMMTTILVATSDPDNRAATVEYAHLKDFAQRNAHRLTPDAQAKFCVYERFVREARGRGQTGILQRDYARMIREMNQTSFSRPPVQEQAASYHYLLDGRVDPARGPACPPGEVGPPPVVDTSQIPPSEIQGMWNRVLDESLRQGANRIGQNAAASQSQKTKKLEKILEMALKSSNIDLAMLLISGLETRRANEVAAGLMDSMRSLQEQRKALADQIGQLGKDGDPSKIQQLNMKAGDLGTEIGMIQTFLQDVMAQKSEAQTMASNFLKSRHETAMGIIRNMG